MKKIAAILVLSSVLIMFSVFSYADSCGDYEYAELKDMDQETLLKTYCEKLKETRIVMMASVYNKAHEGKFKSCAAVTDKIERVYLKRFKVENRDKLMAMCKE
jgi:hypothetical protein